MEHIFVGKWISNEVFAKMQTRNVFYRQLERPVLDCSKHRNEHILFRKRFSSLTARPQKATVYISADDYYKLYINGSFVAQGPAPSYHFRYNYNAIDVSAYLEAYRRDYEREGLSRDGDFNRIQNALLDGGAWLRMLREDATTTFEGWGKDTKWNTSLFHLTMSYAALFIADADLEDLFST